MDGSTLHEGLPIVVGVDGSLECLLALRWAKKLAVPLGATIKAVTAWHLEVVFAPYAASEFNGEPLARQIQDQALMEAFGDDPPEGLIGECRRGQPAKVLIEEANKGQMLIVGSRGRGGFAGMLLGSVSSACAAHTRCPVLVVHADRRSESAQIVTGAGALGSDADEPRPSYGETFPEKL